jgi:outer membrane protein assembly factor BamB
MNSLRQNSWIQFNIFGGIAFSDSLGYFGNLMGKLFAVSLKSGAIKWTLSTEASEANHAAYFKKDNTCRDDIQTIIKANEDFYTLYLRMGAIFSTPFLYGAYLVFTSLEGTVYCLKKDTAS